jgi:hypothetical protein
MWKKISAHPENYILCPCCKKKFRSLTSQHIKKHGFLSSQNFKQQYHLEFLRCEALRNAQSRFMEDCNPTREVGHSKETIQKIKQSRKGKGVGYCGTYIRTKEIRAKISAGVTQAHLSGLLQGYPINSRGEWVHCEKVGETAVWVRSSWEERVLAVLDLHPCVLKVVVEPFAIPYVLDGVTRNYIPDFDVFLEGNIHEIWEVKPAYLLTDPKVMAKIAALDVYCNKNSYNARIVTLEELEGMEMQVGLRPWVGPGAPWVDLDNPDYRG